MRMTKTDASQLHISRRAFLYGAGAIAATATASALGCSASGTESDVSDTNDVAIADEALSSTASEVANKLANVETIDTQLGSVAVLSVAKDRVFTTEDCEFVKMGSTKLKRAARAHLPYGTIIWANDDKLAACLLPCNTSNPLTKIGLLSLTKGDLFTVRESAVSENDGFHIYDVRANSNGAIWVEANVLDNKWRLYAAKVLSGGKKLGTPHLVEEGDGEWEMPSLAVSGNYGFWQLTPSPNASTEDPTSMLMRVGFGEGQESVKCVYEAPGRMACAPTPSENGIAIAPKACLEKESGTYYQLTYIDAESGMVESALALPASMKPNYIAYGSTGFSFAFNSIYDYGEGISNLGTYVSTGESAPIYAISEFKNDTDGATGNPDGSAGNAAVGESGSDASAGESAIAAGEAFGEWFRFPRSPFMAPAWLKNWFIVKSTSVVAGVDLTRRRYFSIEPEYALQGYGEYLASEGPTSKIVTYANIDYTPIGGKHIRECNVRIWKDA